MFLFKQLKTDEPINVMIYNDGRAHVSTPGPPTQTQRVLLELFGKSVKKGEVPAMRPGRYHFKFTKVGRRQTEVELINIDE